jgi:hypothetical protein
MEMTGSVREEIGDRVWEGTEFDTTAASNYRTK